MRYKHILLTGATGFLGMHLLNEFLIHSDAHIYCLTRNKDVKSAQKYFNEVSSFYFGPSFLNLFGSRITVVEGDFTKKDFGMSSEQQRMIYERCDLIIHSGALVKSIGEYKQVEHVNVTGTEMVIHYAKKHNLPVAYISTLSLMGIYTYDKERTTFEEKDFDIGQQYNESIYITSKRFAEKKILQARKMGVKADIFRVGLMSARTTDGMFQRNIERSFLYNRIRNLIQTRCIAKEYLNGSQEISPVDLCSFAIFKILEGRPVQDNTYHISNTDYIKVEKLIRYLREEERIDIKILEKEEYSTCISNLMTPENIKKVPLDLLVQSLKKETTIPERAYPMTVSAAKTTECLTQLGFQWPLIDSVYLHKILMYLSNIGFIDLQDTKTGKAGI